MVITNFKKFLQEGGTQTEPKEVLKQFQTQIEQAGGTIKPSVKVITTRTSGRGGGGVTYVPPTTIPAPIIPTPEPSKEWSGKVEEISPKGEVVGVTYIAEGKKVGEVREGYAYVPPTVSGATLRFGEEEKVTVGKKGISVETYEYKPSKAQDIFIKSTIGEGIATPTPYYAKGTMLDFNVPEGEWKVYAPGTTYGYQTGIAGTSKWGTSIPEVKFYTVGEDWASKPATQKEIQNLLSVGRISTEKRGQLKEIYGETTGKITKFMVEPTSSFSLEQEKSFKEFFARGGKGGEIVGGTAWGVIPKTKGELITTGITFGAGGLVGAGFKGASIGLKAIPKIGGVASKGFKIAGLGAGAYLTAGYGLGKVGEISATPDYFAKGEILGETSRELSAFGFGFGAGQKGVSMLQGLVLTKGKISFPLERLTRESVISGKESFPTAPPRTHLKLFKETALKLPELTEGRAGGFHVTGEKFWKGEIIPQAGTSELPGLYVSPEASIHFARISGISGKIMPKIETLFKDFLTEGKPGIAFLKPERFREVGFKKVAPYKIGEQPFRYAFKQRTELGVMDIPKMKTEIEAIARVNAGKYLFESGKYYTTIKGVRVPIDVFGYEKLGKFPKLTERAKAGKIFEPKEYSLPKSSIFPKLYYGLSYGKSSYQKAYSSVIKSYLPSPSSLYRVYSYKPYGVSYKTSYKPYKRSYYLPKSYFYSPTGYSGVSAMGYPTSGKPPVITKWFPDLYFGRGFKGFYGLRKFQRTPSFGAVVKQTEFGIKTPKLAEKFEITGLVERGGKIPRHLAMPITYLKGVKFTKMKGSL